MASGEVNMDPSDSIAEEKTLLKVMSMDCYAGGAPSMVDVKNDRIVRIRPFRYDWKYTKEEMPWWQVTAPDGTVFEPRLKSQPPPYALAYKAKIYSESRIKFPMKRVDWDPNGDRNPQNRGKSKYVRISWDEATDIIAGEIRRIHAEYGPYGILCQGDGHSESKTVQGAHGCMEILLKHMGGYTLQVRNPDSWEGWWWGTKHVWGDQDWGQYRADNCFKDVTEHSETLLFWGGDLETTPLGFGGQMASRMLYFWSEVGKRCIYVCPDLNYAAAVHADKWIPVLPNTDAAMQLAIAYVWLQEGTFKQDYLDTHTVGFDKCKAYILGEEDGIPKTPEWASKKCGVPEWTIKALARRWGKTITSTVHYMGGGYIRSPYSHEPARLEAMLLAMQGLGGPGVHSHQPSFWRDLPKTVELESIGESGEYTTATGDKVQVYWTGRLGLDLSLGGKPLQLIPKTLIDEAILNPPIKFTSSSSQGEPVEDQFDYHQYPLPKEMGGTEVHMIWTDSPCHTTCWNGAHRDVEAFRSPKIEFILAQHMTLHSDAQYADVIIPINTAFEETDIGFSVEGTEMTALMNCAQCCAPVGESKSDLEAVGEIAKKLGLYDEYMEGHTAEEMCKLSYEAMNLVNDGLPGYDEYMEKGYTFFKVKDDWQDDPPGMRAFYDDPEANPLRTPSGKLELFSQRLADHFPDDEERPPYPKWIEKGEMHDERLSSERADDYSLLVMSNHPRWRVHAQNDEIAWFREIPTCKVKGKDGYGYEPVWIHSSEAAKRGIESGDIVRVFNERGSVLGGAYVTERVRDQVIYFDHGARYDPIIPGELDRGGAINAISPHNIISKNCPGQATSGFLAEVEKVTDAQMAEWRVQYPDAFERKYSQAYGTTSDGWLEGADA